MQPVLQVFRAVTAVPMANSATLEATASSGVLPSTQLRMPGAVTFSITAGAYTVTTPIRVLVFQFAVSGINDYLSI